VVLFSLEILDALIYGTTDNEFVGPNPKNVLFVADSKVEAIIVSGVYYTEVTRIEEGCDLGMYMKNLKGYINDMPTNKKNKIVVLMNPPYQKNTGGGIKEMGSVPVYQDFISTVVENVQPEFMVSIHPSRWAMGGKGLTKFRDQFKTDRHIAEIVDYKDCHEVFETVDIAGGVQILKWDKNHNGLCKFNGKERDLNQYDIILRDQESISILERVLNKTTLFLNEVVSPQTPFGLTSNFNNWCSEQDNEAVKCFSAKKKVNFVKKDKVSDITNSLNKYKVIVPKAPIAGQTDFSKPISFFNENNVQTIGPNSVCTQTYLVVNSFGKQSYADNFKRYMLTKFFRFMLSLRVVSQDAMRAAYSWVPDMQDYSVTYTDEFLYAHFGLTQEEVAYIKSKIR
jgi:site-specific DNA-methyltransferase (adenine-specific)